MFVLFIRLALESPFVTARLHKWIDLIFGYKQRGSKAIKACNTFQFISYEGSIDVDSLGTQAERDVCLQQIREFGQIPAQVFQSPHPASKAAKASAANSFASSAEGSSGVINSTKPLMDALISTDAFEPPVQFTNSVSESVEIQRQLYSYDCKDFRTSRADASIAHFSGSIVAVSIAQGAEAALIAASGTFSGSAEKFVPTDELSMGPPVSRLCIQSYVVLCPDSAIFLPFYDVMASGRPDHAVRERSEINLSGTGIGVSHGIMAAWGYSDCTFKVFFNSFGSLNGSKSSDKTNRHELVSSREWEFVRSINYPNITVSCAACSNSGRLLMTGHAHYSAIQKWRVYPTMLGNSDKLKKMSTAAVSAHLDCNIVLVESIPCSAHQGCIDSIAISVCNGIVVTACRAGTVVLWSLDSLEQTKIFPNATIIENPAFCCNSAHVIVSSVVIETTTGYIYFSIGPDVIVTDVNGRVLGCIHPTDVHNSTTVTCISPTTGLGMTSLLTKASGSLFSVIIGYSCGEVRTWQAASCNLTDSGTDRAHNGNGKLQSVIVHCCSTVQLPCKLAAQSLAIPRPRRSRGSFPMTSENSDLIDVFISLSDGSVHVLKLNSELTFLHK